MRANYIRQFVWAGIYNKTLLSSFGCGESDAPQPRPPKVEVVQVQQKDVPARCL